MRLRRFFDTGERVETALNFLESASTFASTFAVLSAACIDKTLVFTDHLTSDSDETPVLRLFYGTRNNKVLIIRGIIDLEAEVGIGLISPPLHFKYARFH